MHFSLYRGLASLLLAPDGREIPITTIQNILHMQRTSVNHNGNYKDACLSLNEEFAVIQRLQQHLQHVNAGFESIYGQGGTDGFGSFNISHEKWDLGVFRENLRRGVEQIVKTVLRGSAGYTNLAQTGSPTQTPTPGSRKPSLYTSKQSESINRMLQALENAYFYIVGEAYRQNNSGLSSPPPSGHSYALYSTTRHPVYSPSNMPDDVGSRSVPAISLSNHRNNDSFSSFSTLPQSPDVSSQSEPKHMGGGHEDAIQKTQLLTEALKPAKVLGRMDSSSGLKWTRSLSRRRSKKTLKRAISNPHLVSTTQNLDNTIDLVHLPQTNQPYNQDVQSQTSYAEAAEARSTSSSTMGASQYVQPEASLMRSTSGYVAGTADTRASAQSRESQGSKKTVGSISLAQPSSCFTDGHSSTHSTELAPFGKEPGPIMYVQSHAPAFSQRLDRPLPAITPERNLAEPLPERSPPVTYPLYPSISQTQPNTATDVLTYNTGSSAPPVTTDISTQPQVRSVPTPVSDPSNANTGARSFMNENPMAPATGSPDHFMSDLMAKPEPALSVPMASSPYPVSDVASASLLRPTQDIDRTSYASTVANGEVITFPSIDEPSLDAHQTQHNSIVPERDAGVKATSNTFSFTSRKSHGDSVYDMYFAKSREDDTNMLRTPPTDQFKNEVPVGSRVMVTSQYFADPSRTKSTRTTQRIGSTSNPIWQVVAGLNDRTSMYSEVGLPDKRASDVSVVSRRDPVATDPTSEQDSRAFIMAARSVKPDFQPLEALSLPDSSLQTPGGFDMDDDTHTLSSTEDVPDDGKRNTLMAPAVPSTPEAPAPSNTSRASSKPPAPGSSPIIEYNDQGLPVQIVYYKDDELPEIMDRIASGNNSARIEFRRRSAYPDMRSEQATDLDDSSKGEDASHLARVEQSILSLLRPTFSSLKLGS
ncbi:hypothetical protein MNAN1_004007, partial [Malassezia nana]